jgi:phosphoenolpyruvate carboxykinase (GTP)
MKPFCGYNFADYFAHWLSFDVPGASLPRIFHVNWFRKDQSGKFLWPGFRENLRVLEWMIERVEGRVGAKELPIGLQPLLSDFDGHDAGCSAEALSELFCFDRDAWKAELGEICVYLAEYGEKLPPTLLKEAHNAFSTLR